MEKYAKRNLGRNLEEKSERQYKGKEGNRLEEI
jgi:hypothetical protein